jgi:microcystin-dependent protein
MDCFIGVILPTAFNFAPVGWMKCEGQVLQRNQYMALFSLIGTQYGGSGDTFQLPDLRARTMVGAGSTPDFQNLTVTQGQKFGAPVVSANLAGMSNVSLSAANLPKHNHEVTVSGSSFTAESVLNATGNGPGVPAPAPGVALGASGTSGGGVANIYVSGATPSVAMQAQSVTTKIGGSATVTTTDAGVTPTPLQVPFNIPLNINPTPPSLGMNFIICVQGLYPTRN